MQSILKLLSEDIGERFAGTASEHRAARALRDVFAERGLAARLQGFGFIGWRLLKAPEARVVAPTAHQCSAAAILYSASTPPGGATGRVAYHGRKTLIAGLYEMETYAVLDDDGAYLAHLVVEPSGPAIPLLNPQPIFRLPLIVIGAEDGRLLGELLSSGTKVIMHVEIQTELLPDAVGYNVIAEYRGRPELPDRIIVDAHYDTQLNTPGCYDNASGVAGLYGVLDEVHKAQLPINIDFVAVSGEEVGMHGSTYLCMDLKERGLLSSVRACICLDQVSAGETLWIWSSSGAFRDKVLASAASSGLDRLGPLRVDDPMPGCDMWPFHLEGVPSCLFMWWRLPDYHKPTDTLEKVDLAKLEATVRAAFALLASLGSP